jgi:hypothetical protein
MQRRGALPIGSASSGQEDRVQPDAAVVEVRDARAERDHAALAVLLFDFEYVAGAEIFDRGDGAERLPFRADAWQPDQVGMIIFTLFERRESGPGDG